MTEDFGFVFRDLRDNGRARVKTSTLAVAGEEQFAISFMKWCVDRHEDHGERLKSDFGIRFKDAVGGWVEIVSE